MFAWGKSRYAAPSRSRPASRRLLCTPFSQLAAWDGDLYKERSGLDVEARYKGA